MLINSGLMRFSPAFSINHIVKIRLGFLGQKHHIIYLRKVLFEFQHSFLQKFKAGSIIYYFLSYIYITVRENNIVPDREPG